MEHRLCTRIFSVNDLVKLKTVAPHGNFYFDEVLFAFLTMDMDALRSGECAVIAATDSGRIHMDNYRDAITENTVVLGFDDFVRQIGIAPVAYRPKKVLVDLDDTTVDFVGTKRAQQDRHRFPQSQPGFYRSLPLLPGAYEAICAIENDPRFQVYFCSAPSRVPNNAFCLTEKAQFIVETFGEKFYNRLVLAMDKSMVKGHTLIDNLAAGRGQENFEGELIVYHPETNNWGMILDHLHIDPAYRGPMRDTLPDFLP